MAKREYDKMLTSEPYLWTDAELVAMQEQARDILQQYNTTSRRQTLQRTQLLNQLLGRAGQSLWIESPFYCDYGRHIFLGDDVYMNMNCMLIDCHYIEIGSQTFLGPSVQIYTATHPTDSEQRNLPGHDLAYPVRIGTRSWIGGGAIILPGVTIGDNTTIGAGSVVTHDIPSSVVAVGNPCRILRYI
jgi:maltose O-acetyltransferase